MIYDEALDSWACAGTPTRQQVLALVRAMTLAPTPVSVTSLVSASGIPRATVERFAEDICVEKNGHHGYDISGEHRERLLAWLGRNEWSLSDISTDDFRDQVSEWIRLAPPADSQLDHVQANAMTVVRRAEHLCGEYLSNGMSILFLGDHDLTSLATAALSNRIGLRVSIYVADIDERILQYISTEARKSGFDISTSYADFRVGLPSQVMSSMHLVFTDPPYTPEGIRLFAARAVACLARLDVDRIVMAYGYSERNPALGYDVQDGLNGLRLVFESILPSFNEYIGAEAIGSRAALYSLRPTRRTEASARKLIVDTRSANIYTHGRAAVEADSTSSLPGSTEVADAVWIARNLRTAPPNSARQALDSVLSDGLGHAHRHRIAALLATDEVPSTVLRCVLALPNPEVAVHMRPQRALTDALPHLGRALRYRFNDVSDSGNVIRYLARHDDPDENAQERAARYVFARVHGKLGNILRESFIRLAGEYGQSISKSRANEILERELETTELRQRIIDLPDYSIGRVLDLIETTDIEALMT